MASNLDNWTYLKIELNWLERLLLLAAARQKKEAKEIDRVAQTRVDRATSHWWKGLVSLEGLVAHDSPVEPRKAGSADAALKGTYQQQVEARVRSSHQQGAVLALPILCDRLSLSPFEKNLILLGLAPEVHRRYAQLYGYLQGKEQPDLPNIDLALRLFCRNDSEWRTGRSSFSASSPLVRHQLIELVFSKEASLLSRSIKLSDSLVDFLLADAPDVTTLEELLSQENSTNRQKRLEAKPQPLLNAAITAGSFSDLVLPESLLATLQHLCHQIQFCSQVDEGWGFQDCGESLPGVVALLVGASGTGKTTAANAIAQRLHAPLNWVDLSRLNSSEHADLLQEIAAQAPTVLLIKSAQIWLGRRSPLSQAEISQFLQMRRKSGSLTFFSVQRLPAIQQAWKRHLQPTLHFPVPDQAARSRLWQQAFPSQVPLHSDIDWEVLASKFTLTGGEIQAIARSAAFYAIADSQAKLNMQHLLDAIDRA